MLPYAMQLDKTGPVPEVDKFAVGANHIAVLYNNGELYTKGSNSSGKLGTGTLTDSYDNWNLVLKEVYDVYLGIDCTLAVMRDGTFKVVGSLYALYAASTRSPFWIDCTAKFPVEYQQIRDIQIGDSSMLINVNTNDLYSIGLNSRGELGINQGTTPSDTAKFISGSTRFCSLSNFSTMFLSMEYINYCGSNDSGLFGTGNTRSYFDAEGDPSNADGIYTTNYTSYLYFKGGGIKSAGDNAFGQLGTGSVSANSLTFEYMGGTDTTDVLAFATSKTGKSYTICTPSGIYSTGYGPCTGLNTTRDVYSFSKCILPEEVTNFGLIKDIGILGIDCTFFMYDNRLYGTGSSKWLGTQDDSPVFIRTKLPYS